MLADNTDDIKRWLYSNGVDASFDWVALEDSGTTSSDCGTWVIDRIEEESDKKIVSSFKGLDRFSFVGILIEN